MSWAFQGQCDPEDLLARIKARMRENLARIPDFVCLQTVERLRRPRPGQPFEAQDTLRLEVGFAGKKEIFAWRGARRFEEKELADLIGRGSVGTGSFAVHASNVFLFDGPEFRHAGEETLAGRRATRFDYEVPLEASRYRVRVPPHQARVPFHGSFWVDAGTLDLIRLEVQAEEIPAELGLAQVSDTMEYAWTRVGDSDFLLPHRSEFTMVGLDGAETRNRTEFTGCQRYAGEATVSFDKPATAVPAQARPAARIELPQRAALELSLDGDISPESVAVGDEVRAVLAGALKNSERVVLPPGTPVHGRIVRLEKETLPFPHYVIGLQFDRLETSSGAVEFSATMEDVENEPGLIRQAKRLDPTFTRRRAPRMDILIRERQRGQGILHWDARRAKIPRGLRMRWRLEAVQQAER